MEGASMPYNPRTVEEVFKDFRARRSGMVKALTTDVKQFYEACDPEKENLCLYGHPSGIWEVNLPAEEVPPELPEPALGINFARDGMEERDWLTLVAVHSDAWLLAVSFYFGARFGFGKNERRKLFNMINDLPTIYEAVSGNVKTQAQAREKTPNSSNKSKSNSKTQSRQSESHARGSSKPQLPPRDEDDESSEEEEEDEDEHGTTLCGSCGEYYANDEFWICCDVCEKWFHGKCVRITPARAEHIKQYKCPSCSGAKRGRV
ncbi:PHD finger protein ALFIN-LIKE 5 [Acorus calamus]|uniref:PHD finger protein ALFIN-LIKE n=1 Tax=Acorus calamus TaxID=4465 RepID=A0AAV9CIG9_ACOCL|nr:PHD finger protein ALFIN-LIKE 5 [Acorus calamus]